MTENIPLELIHRLERMEAQLMERDTLAMLKKREEETMKTTRLQSIFAGVGKPVHPSYSYQAFPCVRYSLAEPTGRFIKDIVELDSLGPGWVDSPAKLEDIRLEAMTAPEPKGRGK